MFISIVTGPPYDLQVESRSDGDGLIISVPVARDDRTRVVLVQTILQPATIDDFLYQEIVFQIAITSLDDSFEAFITQMRTLARQYLPGDCKQHVMNIVCESCKILLETVKPDLIYAVTKESNLPEKALKKYALLKEAIESCGYAIHEVGTDLAERTFWKWSGMWQPPSQLTAKAERDGMTSQGVDSDVGSKKADLP